MDKTTTWLVAQYRRPAAAYSTAEWAKMAGLPTARVTRWFERRGLVVRSKGRKQGHHTVSRDALQDRWPDFWRSIRRRLADLAEEAG